MFFDRVKLDDPVGATSVHLLCGVFGTITVGLFADPKIAKEIGRADVNSFMKRLFRERSWGDMAESETYAHLEHLRLEGKAEAHRNEQGRLVYEL